MNEQWQHSGEKVAVYLQNQEALVAWLVHEDATKLILALDPERRNLRTIFRRDIVQLAVDPNRESWIEPVVGAQRLRRLREFEPTLIAEVEPALERVDYRRLTRNAKRLRHIATQGELGEERRADGRDEPPDRGRPSIQAQDLYESLDLSLELYEELERTRLIRVVVDYPDHLRQLVHEETLPAFDAEWAGREGPYHLLKVAQESEGDLIEAGEMLREARDNVWSRKDSARWLDGAGDVVLGASFATANVALGAIAGIVGSLPTLGIGTVAAVVGVGHLRLLVSQPSRRASPR